MEKLTIKRGVYDALAVGEFATKEHSDFFTVEKDCIVFKGCDKSELEPIYHNLANVSYWKLNRVITLTASRELKRIYDALNGEPIMLLRGER